MEWRANGGCGPADKHRCLAAGEFSRQQPLPAGHYHLPHRLPVPYPPGLGCLGHGAAEHAEGRDLSTVGPDRDRVVAVSLYDELENDPARKGPLRERRTLLFHHTDRVREAGTGPADAAAAGEQRGAA